MDSDHIQRSKQVSWQYRSVSDPLPIPVMVDIDAGVLTKQINDQYSVRYVVKDIIQMTVHATPSSDRIHIYNVMCYCDPWRPWVSNLTKKLMFY